MAEVWSARRKERPAFRKYDLKNRKETIAIGWVASQQYLSDVDVARTWLAVLRSWLVISNDTHCVDYSTREPDCVYIPMRWILTLSARDSATKKHSAWLANFLLRGNIRANSLQWISSAKRIYTCMHQRYSEGWKQCWLAIKRPKSFVRKNPQAFTYSGIPTFTKYQFNPSTTVSFDLKILSNIIIYNWI